MSKRILAAVIFTALLAGQATAAINTTDRGWYDSTGFHDPNNAIYISGGLDNEETDPVLFRSFFYFNLSGVTGTFSSATFEAFNPVDGYQSPDATETLRLFDVSTPLADLLSGGVNKVNAYNDLGSGTEFGFATVSAANNSSIVSFNLNPAGLAAVNAAVAGNGVFVIGGALEAFSNGNTDEYVFGFSGFNDPADGDTRLILEPDPGQVPEPGSLALLAGLSLLIGVRHIRLRRFRHNLL